MSRRSVPSMLSAGLLVMFVVMSAWAARPVTAASGPTTFFPSSGLGAIPDGVSGCAFPGSPLDVTFDVVGVEGEITDISVSFELDPPHSFAGDLDVRLIAPGAVERIVIASPSCGSSSDVAGPYTFSDAASVDWAPAASTVPPGAYRATDELGAPAALTPTFAAGVDDPNGTWTLRFRDMAPDDIGSVSAAALRIATADGPDFALGDNATVSHKCKKRAGKTTCFVKDLEIANVGNEASPLLPSGNPVVVELYKSEADLGEGKVWGKGKITQPIEAGASTLLKVKVKKGAAPDEFIVRIDTTGQVDELSEANNQDIVAFAP